VSRRIIVHSLAQAQGALAAAATLGVPVTLESAAGAGTYGGPLWFKALIETAHREHPTVEMEAVLDCAEEAGTALGALRAGIARVRFSGPAETRRRLSAIAEALGATLEGETENEALDLIDAHDPEGASRAFLAGNGSPR